MPDAALHALMVLRNCGAFLALDLLPSSFAEGYKVKVLTRSADKARSVFSGKLTFFSLQLHLDNTFE
jgi:hypothetical protein